MVPEKNESNELAPKIPFTPKYQKSLDEIVPISTFVSLSSNTPLRYNSPVVPLLTDIMLYHILFSSTVLPVIVIE